MKAYFFANLKDLTNLLRTRSQLTAIAAGLVLSSCAVSTLPSANQATVTSCVLPADQGATLNGRWITTPAPVPIAFQTGAWSSSEIAMMTNAVNTWNQFFATSMGYPAITIDNNTNAGSQALPTDEQAFCTSTYATNSTFTAFNSSSPMVIYKDGQWPYTPAVIALTTSCQQSVASHEVPVFSNAYMEVNYQYFFVTSDVPDLQSIVLHEFGHLMGLRHSCEVGSTTEGMPDCDSGSLEPAYLSALMYPSFSFNTSGSGQVKRALQSDDEGRMNCLYQDL